jgi:hypothetical protein
VMGEYKDNYDSTHTGSENDEECLNLHLQQQCRASDCRTWRTSWNVQAR